LRAVLLGHDRLIFTILKVDAELLSLGVSKEEILEVRLRGISKICQAPLRTVCVGRRQLPDHIP
jgi:hypothetical protein